MPPKVNFFKKKAYPSKKQSIDIHSLLSAKWLVIVESPSKCKKIEEYLGSDFHCIATKGHFRSIEGLKSINTKGSFEPTFSIMKEKYSQVESIRSTLSHFSKEKILLASDDDREGEAIAWHICQVFDLPVETTPRILFHEVTRPALLAAVANPTVINMKLVQAQHARQVLDIIVGFKISPYLWKYVSNGATALSAGRCQTPALRLVYDNEMKKRTKQGENAEDNMHYKTSASFTSKQTVFVLDKQHESSESALVFLERSKNHHHMLTVGSPKEYRLSPPKPFQTSRLLQSASNMLHISPKETMKHCQELYQNGYITYMRTESSQYSHPFLETMKEFLLKEHDGKTEYLGDFNKLENKDASNPHEAIRVTHLERRTVNSENHRMNAVYQMIWRNTVESCMSTAVFKNTEITISSAEPDCFFRYTTEVPLFLGWKQLGYDKNKTTKDQNNPTALLLWFRSIEESKKPVTYHWIESVVVVTKNHSYYTEASLIQQLEEMGIGRPSTFAAIVETLLDRGYVKKTDIAGSPIQCKEFKLYADRLIEQTVKERLFGNEKNKLVIEPTGINVVEFLIRYFYTLFSYEYTKNMETDLDLISSGEKEEWSSICKECYQQIKTLAKPVTAITKETYPIDENHTFTFNKFGPVIRKKVEGKEEPEYLSVKKEIQLNLEKLKKGEYLLEDLIEIKTSSLGKHNGKEVLLKTGRYGLFVECGEVSKSLKFMKKPIAEIVLEDVVPYLEGEQVDGKNVLRVLNASMSIRKGRFGAYVFYKTSEMEKPQFLNIKKFPGMFSTCEKENLIQWLCNTYGIQI